MKIKRFLIPLPRICWLLVLLLSAVPVKGQTSALPRAGLGKVNFPTSCSAEAQPLIEKGVALLHSFQYQETQQTFAEAQSQDPKCAMAHWGKAMSFYEQLWSFPDKKKLGEGHQEIQEAKKLHPTTAKEQGFITAAAAYYQKSPAMKYGERTKAYSSALEKLYMQMPDDVEVGSFYALSLVSLAEQDVEPMVNLKKAIAILNPLMQQYPNHPGVAHYLIHAADRPELASQGLEAARRYADIAPDSPHALHMPSHIFVRLGLWQDSIRSNIASEASAARLAEQHKEESHYQTHAMDFLNYSYLQSGQESKAREVIGHVDHVVGASEESKKQHRAYLAARTALELHRWKEAASLPIPTLREHWKLDETQWARAIGAARSGDVAGVETAVSTLRQCVAERERRDRKKGYSVSKEKPSDLAEAEAWLAYAQGKAEEALAELRSAAEYQEENGGESTTIPAREMLADMLTELKRPAEALSEYKIVLQNSPNRFDALLGAARGAQVSGDTKSGRLFYAKLTQVCSPDADRPELGEVKKFVAQQ